MALREKSVALQKLREISGAAKTAGNQCCRQPFIDPARGAANCVALACSNRDSVTVRYGICSVSKLIWITIAVVKVSQCNIHPIMAVSREMVSRRATEALWSTPSSVAPSVSVASVVASVAAILSQQ